jgi:hypothetical protein
MVHRPGRQVDADGQDDGSFDEHEAELDRLRESVLGQPIPSTFTNSTWTNVFRSRTIVESSSSSSEYEWEEDEGAEQDTLAALTETRAAPTASRRRPAEYTEGALHSASSNSQER